MGRGWEKAPDVERGGYNVWARNIKAMGDEVMQLLSQGDDYEAGAQLAAVAGGGAGARGIGYVWTFSEKLAICPIRQEISPLIL